MRGLQHDLAARGEIARTAGLALRSRTAAHLDAMVRGREYLVTRYGADHASTLSQINRLQATLDEISRKVGERLERAPGSSSPLPLAEGGEAGRGGGCRGASGLPYEAAADARRLKRQALP